MVAITIIRDRFPKHMEGLGTHYSVNQDRENGYRYTCYLWMLCHFVMYAKKRQYVFYLHYCFAVYENKGSNIYFIITNDHLIILPLD